jgi:hypothetical protein
MEGFAAQGGTINLIKKQNKIRFEINLDAARSARLMINSKLLGLARILKARMHEEE